MTKNAITTLKKLLVLIIFRLFPGTLSDANKQNIFQFMFAY